ncbi:hypothetical protein ACJX0J_015011, partial [Zea mays]
LCLALLLDQDELIFAPGLFGVQKEIQGNFLAVLFFPIFKMLALQTLALFFPVS